MNLLVLLQIVELDHKQISERTLSPILFEGSMEASSVNDQQMDNSVEHTHNTVSELQNDSSKKKPIFKKAVKNVRNVQHIKTEVTGDTAELDVNSTRKEVEKESGVFQEVLNDNKVKRENTIDNTMNESKEDDIKVEQVKSENNQDGSYSRRKSRGKFDRSIIDKLKPFRRRSVTDTKDTSKEEVMKREGGGTVLQDLTKEIKDVENLAESDTPSDEEFLCTRRKSGRKRPSTGTSKLATKRQKGVHYEDKESKENKVQYCRVSVVTLFD